MEDAGATDKKIEFMMAGSQDIRAIDMDKCCMLVPIGPHMKWDGIV